MSRNPPVLGEHHPERLCGYCSGLSEDGEEVVCLKNAVIHIAWKDEDPVTPGGACEEHREAALALEPAKWHPLGADCGMPGSRWMWEDNYCVVNEMPVAEIREARLKKVIT